MPEFFLELFSEEIPARMQAAAAQHLAEIVKRALAPLGTHDVITFHGPRRVALSATVQAQTPTVYSTAIDNDTIRGPKLGAPQAAIDGFLRKNGGSWGPELARERLIPRDGHYHLLVEQVTEPQSAMEIVSARLGLALVRFPWPKSMRWGQSGSFTWVRPLRRVVCLLDGTVVPILLGPVKASDVSEGHRFLAPGTFHVSNVVQWQSELLDRKVIVDAGERRRMIEIGLTERAQARGLVVVKDDTLVDEVVGLVECPVVLLGAIETRFMSLPPEVRELSMKVNQRYFATRDLTGAPAPVFAFVANIEAADGGAAIVAGNERVLRARLADAEHFWTLDRKLKLADYLPRLKAVTFHAKLGSQFERAERIANVAGQIADQLNMNGNSDKNLAIEAARLCKADLVTGMVGEFPELQGIMGGYYADDPTVGAAIRSHYQPKGPKDDVPRGAVACVVALADKIDTLLAFFRLGEKPTGSGDPYALRRAALGVIRIVVENEMRLNLSNFLMHGLYDFMIERFRVKLRNEGRRFDVLDAAIAGKVLEGGIDADFLRLTRKIDAIEAFLKTDDGANLLSGYRRAANILRIENERDGPHDRVVIDPNALRQAEEIALGNAIRTEYPAIRELARDEKYRDVMIKLASFRSLIDDFFDMVKVNTEDAFLRLGRLYLLNEFIEMFNFVADFSKLEG